MYDSFVSLLYNVKLERRKFKNSRNSRKKNPTENFKDLSFKEKGFDLRINCRFGHEKNSSMLLHSKSTIGKISEKKRISTCSSTTWFKNILK